MAVLALVFSGLAACGRGRSSNGPVAAPPFELQDLSGKTIKLEDFRGHPILLDFWATWCGPCRISIPLVDQFYQRHKQDGLVVLGMNVDDERSNVFPFVKEMGITYPVLLAGASPVSSDYQVEGLPTFYLIDSQGKVVDRYEGFHPDMVRAWEAELQSLLKKTS